MGKVSIGSRRNRSEAQLRREQLPRQMDEEAFRSFSATDKGEALRSSNRDHIARLA